jgi:8-oxo-dGTP pyrophosphatase MutT (NUDIX family)
LAGHHDGRAGLRQALERGTLRILHSKRVDQRGATLSGKLDLPGGGLKSFQTAQRMLVEGGSSIWMIQYVRE